MPERARTHGSSHQTELFCWRHGSDSAYCGTVRSEFGQHARTGTGREDGFGCADRFVRAVNRQRLHNDNGRAELLAKRYKDMQVTLAIITWIAFSKGHMQRSGRRVRTRQ